MALICNPILFGGGLTLYFKNGTTATVPTSKLHFVQAGTTTLPENTYPILAKPKSVSMTTDSYGWGSAGASFGTSSDMANLYNVSYNDNAQQAGTNGGPNTAFYLPMCVNSLESLQSGSVSYYNNKGSVPSGWSAIYLYADK